jgi:hypothetical protein
MNQRKYLTIYLNDHLAGSTGGHELAKRTYSNNQSGELGGFLRRLIVDIERDKATLEEIMRAVEAPRDRFKARAAWAAEKIGRLKLNGRLTGYSDLSRVVELETLFLGVEGKHSMWEALDEIGDPRLASFDFKELRARARSQLDELQPHRLQAAATALSG